MNKPTATEKIMNSYIIADLLMHEEEARGACARKDSSAFTKTDP